MPKNVYTTQPPANAEPIRLISASTKVTSLRDNAHEHFNRLITDMEKSMGRPDQMVDVSDFEIEKYELFQIYGLHFVVVPEGDLFITIIACGTLVGIPKKSTN